MPSSHTRGGGGLFLSSLQSSVRKGVLPSMLEEILRTRIMVKQSMKAYKQEKALMKLLDARQLGLKLIANVTFGYAAANYSGRMPCVEVSPESRRVPSGGGGHLPPVGGRILSGHIVCIRDCLENPLAESELDT